MLEITELSNQKNKNKLNLFVDGQFYAGILKETAITNNFFVGKKIDKTKLDQIIEESNVKQIFSKASDYLATRMHSRQELYLKLIKKEYPKKDVNLALDRLEEYGYLNDNEFAKLYIESHKKDSRQMLKNKLATKGVNSDIISEVLRGYDDEQERVLALAVATKFAKNKELNSIKQKMYAHLARKGYSRSAISYALHEIYNGDIDEL